MSPGYFLEMMVELSDEKDREKKLEDLQKILKATNKDITEDLERKSFGEILRDQAPKDIIEFIEKSIPIFGGTAKAILENLFQAIKRENKQRGKENGEVNKK